MTEEEIYLIVCHEQLGNGFAIGKKAEGEVISALPDEYE
jgi:hypothetical protein